MTILKSGYGLLHKESNTLLGVTAENDNSGESIGTFYTLGHCDEPIWLVKDKLNASYVRLYSTEWYNAGYDHPINPYEPEELEVVRIELGITIEEPYPIPTFEEYMNLRYNTPGGKSYDPQHCEWVLGEQKKYGRYGIYSLYDLRDTLGEY